MDQVSVIIPTYERSKEWSIFYLKRSLLSVLKQSYKNIEIIVVIDGESNEIRDFLEEFCKIYDCYRILTVIESHHKIGGSGARNLGIKSAKGAWVALLDDDDEWLPNKIKMQIEKLNTIDNDNNNSFCFTSVIIPENEKLLPRKKWKNEYDLTEYLFCTKLGKTKGFIQTSTILARKSFFLKNLFTEGLPQLQDWDWELKARYDSECSIVYLDNPQVYYHSDGPAQKKVSSGRRGPFFEKWLNDREKFFTKKSYSSFYINIVAKGYIKEDSSKLEAVNILTNKVFTNSKVNMFDLETYFSFIKVLLMS